MGSGFIFNDVFCAAHSADVKRVVNWNMFMPPLKCVFGGFLEYEQIPGFCSVLFGCVILMKLIYKKSIIIYILDKYTSGCRYETI